MLSQNPLSESILIRETVYRALRAKQVRPLPDAQSHVASRYLPDRGRSGGMAGTSGNFPTSSGFSRKISGYCSGSVLAAGSVERHV
jgi:hypothetical protein